MPIDTFIVIPRDYYHKLKPAIITMGGELLSVPESLRHEGMEVYNINQTNVTLYFDGENVVVMGHADRDEIEKTRSKLERVSGIELGGRYS